MDVSTIITSDLNLIASAILLRFDFDDIEDVASELEFKGGMTHDAANRESLRRAMKGRNKRYSKRLANDFFDLAGQAFENEQERGWRRSETWDWILKRLEGAKKSGVLEMPDAVRRAV